MKEYQRIFKAVGVQMLRVEFGRIYNEYVINILKFADWFLLEIYYFIEK